MKTTIRLDLFGVALTGLLALSACGGGGGGGAIAPSAVITGDSVDEVGGAALAIVAELQTIPDMAIAVKTEGDGRQTRVAPAEFAKKQLDRLREARLAAGTDEIVSGSNHQYPLECDSGSGMLTIHSDTSFSMVFNNCTLYEDVDTFLVMNGKIIFSNLVDSGCTGSGTLTLQNYVESYHDGGSVEATVHVHGAMNILEEFCGTYIMTVTGKYFAVTVNQMMEAWHNFKVQLHDHDPTYTYSYKATIDLTGLGVFSIDTTTPLTGSWSDAVPSDGVIVVTGANNAKIQMTINSSTLADLNAVTIETDLDPIDGIYEDSVNKSWCELGAQCL